MQIDEEQLKRFILESKLVSRSDLDTLERKAETKKQKFSDVLLSEGKISEIDLKKMEDYVLGIPFVSLIDKKIDFSTLSSIPEPIARNHNIVAYQKNEKDLE